MAKKEHSLEPLKRLRQYEYEMEQAELRKCRLEEQKLEQDLQQLQGQFLDVCTAPKQGMPAGQWAALDSYRWKMKGDIEVATRRLKAAINQSDKQMEKTLEAKRNLEMVERILSKHKQRIEKERETAERKFLDDLAQRKSSLSHVTMEEWR